MSREDQHFRLRLPADLRALIEEAASRNRRSLTAEMIARLEASFANDISEASTKSELHPPTPDNTIYIVLDTDGMPISFNEALTHLSQLNRAAKTQTHSQQIRIIASEHLSSYDRDEDDLALILKYRKLNNKKLGKSAERFLQEFAAVKESPHGKASKKP